MRPSCVDQHPRQSTGGTNSLRGYGAAMSWPDELLARLAPAQATPELSLATLGVVVLTSLVVVLVDPVWRWLRLGVTLVHELGHAVVGVAVGRRFTGFVLRGDMSGHAVTVGPPRGPGRAATTWAGYPAPGIVAVGLVAAVAHRYAALLLAVALAVLLFALPRVRSALTAVVVLAVAAALAALWWWREDTRQAQVLTGTALVLLIGGWRHLATVVTQPSAGSDPGTLRRLTGIPAWVWNASFALALGAATWGVWRLLT